MKKTLMGLAAITLCAGMMTARPALAQDDSAAPAPHAHGGHHGKGPLAAATEGLNLTADQQKTVDDTQADTMTKMKALRDDTTLDPKARHKQGAQIQHDAMDKIRAVLTDDQKTKFDANLAAAREKMRANHPAGDAAGAPAAPPAASNQ